MKHLLRFFAAVGMLALVAGCTTPPSHRTTADASSKLASASALGVAPPDVEVYEIPAGGVGELRDDWTRNVDDLLRTEFAAQTKFKPAPAVADLSPAAQQELAEVSSLLRAISLNQFTVIFGPRELQPANRALDYNVGRIDTLADACGSDALLFVFVRDSYASAGRKALAVLGVLTGAVTGIVITPTLGSTVGTAALVHRDGTVVWFNTHGAASGDLRERPGAAATARTLLAGFPKT